jgi:hypothetical protein
MPVADPNIDQIAPGGVIQLNNSPAPLDDATFDSLFPTDGSSATPAAQPQAAPGTTPAAPAQPAAPASTPNDSPYLTGAHSVYKTPEAAIEGINQKDQLIETLRQRYALTTGIDPISGQPVGQAPVAQQNNYYEDPQRYLTDLYAAAKAGPQQYRDVQAKFMMDTLAPIAPAITRMAREQALDTLKSDIPDAPAVIGTPAYQKALDQNPELKQAIATAEGDFRFHSRLPGLYKIAYLTSQGTQLPDLLKANVTAQPKIPLAAPRPTMTPGTPSPATQTARPNMKTIEGIRAIIADAESRGAKLDF